MNDLDFIEDVTLRRTLEDAMEFILALYERSKTGEKNPLYQEETCRIIILYIISAVEAVLLYFYKVRGEKMEKLEYIHVYPLPTEYCHQQKIGSSVVIAVQKKEEKGDYEIGLHGLVHFFKEKKMIVDELAANILDLNDVRNTFHFSKTRDKKCDIARVEKALVLLVDILKNVPGKLRRT